MEIKRYYLFVLLLQKGLTSVPIPLRPPFYSYFKESFSGEYHRYLSFRYTHVITSRKFQLKKMWRLAKAIAEMKPATEQMMELE